MKRIVITMLALLVSVLVVSSAIAADERVGLIDPQAVLFQHPKYEATLRQIDAIATQKQDEAKKLIDAESDNNKKQQLFQDMRRTIAEEEQKLMQPLFREIDLAVRSVAGTKKITVVLDKGAIFFGGVDITEEVVQELKKQSVGK